MLSFKAWLEAGHPDLQGVPPPLEHPETIDGAWQRCNLTPLPGNKFAMKKMKSGEKSTNVACSDNRLRRR
jgi:hypothetical protein